ncbi:hypothetical protein DFH06DRAFT_484583 [Mycena polygramma]|nr:hypothetical protein DFH06DRAFT_484583 [Mycena polygramma]
MQYSLLRELSCVGRSYVYSLFTKIPHDAQTVPPLPHPLEPPKSMIYGWLLRPELFGPEDTVTVRCDDGSKIDFKRPTTSAQACHIFRLATIAMRLHGAIDFDWLSNEKAYIASLAEVVEGGRVRSRLNGADKIPPAAKLEKLEEMLGLVKKPEWIEFLPWKPSEALLRALDADPPPLYFTNGLRWYANESPVVRPQLSMSFQDLKLAVST